jgi:hypothetical protein
MPINIRRNASHIRVTLQAWHTDSSQVPVQLTLYSAETEVIASRWIRTGESFVFDKLGEGRYVVQLKLPSGLVMNQLKDLDDEDEQDIMFDLHEISPYETSEWSYLLANDQPFEPGAAVRSIPVELRVWQKYDRDWLEDSYPNLPRNITVDQNGEFLQFRTGERMAMLEVSGNGQAPKYVSLPLDQEIRLALQLNTGPDAERYPVKVTVASTSWKAEAILALLKTSGTRQARQMMGGKGGETAEMMLLEKRQNPTEAAIGAYYILKTRDYDRLHNWANNLANYFPWMPDGAIIHAWQMISQPGDRFDRDRIISRLTEAFDRGLPLYAEGLRLLYEGMMWLVRNIGPGEEYIAMLDSVREMTALVDWEQSLTTLNMPLPDPERVGPPLMKITAPVYGGDVADTVT